MYPDKPRHNDYRQGQTTKLETFKIWEEGGAYSTAAVNHQRAVKML